MASAKEENKRKQKRKQYTIDFLLYVFLDKEKAKKSNIAFYDDYDRAFGWINYDVRHASIKPPDALPLDIPDEVIGNYVIQTRGKPKNVSRENSENPKREKNIMTTSY